MKACIRCNEFKPLDEYYRTACTISGHRGVCKACILRESRNRRSGKSGDSSVNITTISPSVAAAGHPFPMYAILIEAHKFRSRFLYERFMEFAIDAYGQSAVEHAMKKHGDLIANPSTDADAVKQRLRGSQLLRGKKNEPGSEHSGPRKPKYTRRTCHA